jgi:hypothetical protein
VWTRVLAPALRTQIGRVWFWLGVGFAIRIAILPLFASSDLLTTAWISTVLVQNHQLIGSNDPPGIFYLSGGLEWVFAPLISPGINSLFGSGASFSPATTLQALSTDAPGINLLVAILKLPYLIADGVVALVLPRFFSDARSAFLAMMLWWFNPISIFTSYFQGQFDVVAVAFLVVAFYCLRTDRRLLFLAALGCATFFEVFTLLVVPFLLLYWWRDSALRDHRGRWVSAALLSQVVAVLSVFALLRLQAPYYESANLALHGSNVNGTFGTLEYSRDMVTGPLTGGIVTFLGYSAKFAISDTLPDAILIVVLAFGFLLFMAERTTRPPRDQVLLFTLSGFLVFYAFSGFLPQWVLWAQPLLILILAKNWRRFLFPYLILVFGFFIYTWYFGPELTVGLLQVTVPVAANWPDPLRAMSTHGIPGILVLNVARALFSAACIWFGYVAAREASGSVDSESPIPTGRPA